MPFLFFENGNNECSQWKTGEMVEEEDEEKRWRAKERKHCGRGRGISSELAVLLDWYTTSKQTTSRSKAKINAEIESLAASG